MIQQRLPRLTIIAPRVIRRDTAFIAPKDMHPAPLNLLAVIRRKQLKEARRCAASVKRDQKTITFSD